MEIKVQANYIKTSPKKLRLLVDMVRKMNVDKAIIQLKFSDKKINQDLLHLVKSAKDAAKAKNLDEEKLYIKTITCNQGPSIKRAIFNSRGRMNRIKKRMSNVELIVSDAEVLKKDKKNIKENKVNTKNKDVKKVASVKRK